MDATAASGTMTHHYHFCTPSCCCRYDAIIDLTRKLNSSYPTSEQVQQTTRAILNSLFPSWLPGAFKVGRACSLMHIIKSLITYSHSHRPSKRHLLQPQML